MLRKLSVRNLKGLSGDFEFDPLTIITGPNFSGKSALLEAVTLALVGHIPELGRQPQSTKLLLSGKVMEVAAVFDSHTITQSWGAKYNIVVKPEDYMFAPVEMVSLVAFNEKTSSEKVQFLLNRSGGDFSPKTIWTAVTKEMVNLGYIQSDMESVKDLIPTDTTETGKWMDTIVPTLKQRKSNVTAEHKGALATVGEVTQQTTEVELPQDFEREVQELRQKRESLAKLTRDASVALGNLSTEVDNHRSLYQRIAAELKGFKEALNLAPTCAKCGSKVDCPTCESKKVTTNAVIQKKEAELVQIAEDGKKKAARVPLLKDIVAKAQENEAPFKQREAELDALQAQRQQFIGRKQAAESASQKVDALRKKKEMFTKLVDVVVEKIGDALTGGMNKTLEVANLLIRPVLGFDIRYQDETFGYAHPDGQFVTMKTLSGAQQAVVNAGIGMALATHSPDKILVLDEMGTIRPDTKEVLITTVSQLIADGIIDQMIAVDPYWFTAGPALLDVKVIDLGLGTSDSFPV